MRSQASEKRRPVGGRLTRILTAAAAAAAVSMTVLVAPPASQPADAAPAGQVLVKGSFEDPGTDGAPPSGWAPVLLENETEPFNFEAVAYSLDGQFPPPAPVPDGAFALETFWQVGSGMGVLGVAAEQTADMFGEVDQDGAGTLSYAAAQTHAASGSVVQWAGALVEVAFTSDGTEYTLRYFHPGSDDYPGQPEDTADGSVRYVIGSGLPGNDSWVTASHDLAADIEARFGVAEFTVDAVRVGNLQDRTDRTPFPNMTTYWDTVVLEAAGEPDTTPPAVAPDGLRPADGATGVAGTAPVTVTFDEPVQAGPGVGDVTIAAGGAPVGGVEATVSGSTLTVAHDELAPATGHTATVPADAVTDRAGNPLPGAVSWSFTTADAAPGGDPAQVHVIDVGQGDSIYVELPDGIDVLIDCGWLSTVDDVIHYLRSRGVDDLDLLVATHPNADHIGACGVLMDEFGAERIIDNGMDGPVSGPDAAPLADYLAARERALHAGATYEVADFQRLEWDSASLEILGPVSVNPADANESSVVAKLTVGQLDFMFTGDIGFDAENDIVSRARQEGIDLDVEFLKVAHHGSRFSTGEPWLSAVAPEWGIISVGENTFGHPTPDTLGRLADAGVQVYRTDQDGDVVVATDGVSANVNGEPVLGEQLPYEPVPPRQRPVPEPPEIGQPDGQQVLANAGFELPGQNEGQPTGWVPVWLDAERNPFALETVTYGADGRFPPPQPILEGEFALEVFWQTGDAVGELIGAAAEQTSDRFDAGVDHTGEVTFSYAAVQTLRANPDGADWGAGLAEVLFTGGDERQYTLRYVHPNSGRYRGEIDTTGSDTVRYVRGQAFPADDGWIWASHDLGADIAEEFGIEEFTVDSVRVGNLQQRNTSWPFSGMTTYWDLVQLHTTNPVTVDPGDPPESFVANQPITAGRGTSLATTDGAAWSWGTGVHATGQQAHTRTVPEPVPDLAGVAAVAAGESHTLTLLEDGTVWGWGGNRSGQLGDGNPVSRRLLPVQASGLDGVVAIEASAPAGSSAFSLALRQDGTVWAWGNNSSGQLGDGSTSVRIVPTRVRNLTGVVDIAAGGLHSLALTEDGTVWAWGRNATGQVGDGTTQPRLQPVQVAGLTDVVAVAASNSTSYALRADGTVWAWGANFAGLVGDGTTEHRLEPVQVVGLTDVVAIDPATAVRSDGTVWAWGANQFGQVGDGTTETRHAPVQVTGVDDVVEVAAGSGHRLALEADGQVWAWGNNGDGQLGDDTTENRTVPVPAEIALESDACPDGHSPDGTVRFGDEDSGVPNVDRGDGCTILDLVWAGAPFDSHGGFVRHTVAVTDQFVADDLISARQRAAIMRAAASSGVGRPDGGHRPVAQTGEQYAIHFIDVGQAEGAYIQLPGVVDCGRWTSGDRVRDYLVSQQVDDAELLVATHPDADHIGGCDEIMQHYELEQIIDNGTTAGTQTYQTYEDAREAEIADGAVYQEADFQHWHLGDVSFDLLGPVTPTRATPTTPSWPGWTPAISRL